MAASINIPVYSDALVVLGTAGIVVPMVRFPEQAPSVQISIVSAMRP